MSLPDDIRRGTLKAAWSDTTGDRGERFDELAADIDAWKKAWARAHATIDEHCRAIDGIYQAHATALDADDDPAPLETRETLNGALAALLLDLGKAYRLAVRLDDPRSKRIVDALSAMPGDGR